MKDVFTPLVRFSFLMLLLTLVTPSTEVAAQQPEPRPGDEIGEHIVGPGETLSSITQKYLGVARLWRENQRLNPTVSDPNRLRIGQKLRVITHRDLPDRAAEIRKVSNEVEQQQAPRDWERAQEGAKLKRNDGVRTERRSSAELGFDDDTALVVSELSLVYIRQIDERLTGVKEQKIEINYGEADLASSPARAGSSEIEILVGGAVARPQPGPSGRIESRLRTDDSGDAAVMVYDGESAVESGGQSVAVGTGMGTSVPDGQAPSPPEKLLPPPTVQSPATGSNFDYSNPLFRWNEVAGAASYKVEVCRDRECGSLIEIAAGLSETSWRPESLPSGALYWRVRGISASGLDGYPSRDRNMTRSESMTPDLTPPGVALRVVPPGRADSPTSFALGARGAIEPLVHDDASGVESVRYRWDNGRWRQWQRGVLRAPDNDEVHRLEIQATDNAGRTSEIVTIQVQRMSEAPAPPTARAIGD